MKTLWFLKIFYLGNLQKINKISLVILFGFWLLVPTKLFADNGQSEFIVGVITHFPQGKNRPIEKTIGLINDIGVDSLRDEIYWFMVETKKGEYSIPKEVMSAIDIAIKNGIKPLIILSYGNKLYQDGGSKNWWHGGLPTTVEAQDAFANYAKFIATTFKGKIVLYEVWNEWNIGAGYEKVPSSFNKDPTAYFNLLKKTYNALKSVDKNIIVLGGSVVGYDSDWIHKIMGLGAIKYMDGFSIHPYSYRTSRSEPEAFINNIEPIHNILKRYSNQNEFPIYITEIGWPNHRGPFGTPPEVSADYLARFFFLAKSKSFIKGVWWYALQDDGHNVESEYDNFGLVTLEFSKKSGYLVLREIIQTIKETEFFGKVNTEPHLWALKFKHSDGKYTLALWSTQEGRSINVKLKFSGEVGENVFLKEIGRDAQEFKGKLDSNKSISIAVSGRPWLLKGVVGGVEINQD